jgi:large subunit ribosomal protein L24
MQRLCVGDDVIVIRGEDKGKRGKITRVIRERNAVVIEGINSVKRHLKATPQRPGGILEVEAALPASKVMLADPKTGKPTRVRVRIENDEKLRVAASGEPIHVKRG